MDVVPYWIMIASDSKFRKHLKMHYKTKEERMHFMEMRRKFKNRVSGTWKFHNFSIAQFLHEINFGKCKIGHIGHFNTFTGSEFS